MGRFNFIHLYDQDFLLSPFPAIVWYVQCARPKNQRDTATLKDDEVYLKIEKQPEYPGGIVELQQYIYRELRYPEAAKRRKIEGTVYLNFVINKDGSVSQVQVLKGIDNECDMEAMRLITEMPRWTPGMQDGKPVKVRFSMPVKFRLPNK